MTAAANVLFTRRTQLVTAAHVWQGAWDLCSKQYRHGHLPLDSPSDLLKHASVQLYSNNSFIRGAARRS